MADLPGLGEFQAPTPAWRAAGAVGYLLTLVMAAGLERLQFKLRAAESGHWWASNGRDAINAGALLAIGAGLKTMGFSLPIALLLAGTLVLGLSLVQTSLERHRHAGLLSVGMALLFGTPVLLFPDPIEEGCRKVLEAIF